MPISTRAVRFFGQKSLAGEGLGWQSQLEQVGSGIGESRAASDFALRSLGAVASSPGDTDRAVQPDGGGIFVATNLTPAAGVAIVAYATDPIGADGDDIIRFVLLSAIGSGTQIFFTDRNWNGTAFAAASAGENTFTYTAGADLPAGTVVTISSAQILAAGMDLSNNGETVYVYQGTDANTPTTFLNAIDVGDGNNVFEAGELTGTGLTAGVNAVAVGHDQASFAGQSTQIAQTQLAAISNNVQWHGHSGDDIGGTIYDDRADVSLSGPLTNPDMQLFGMMSGGGQSDAFIRMDNEEASNVATNLTRLFRDNPMFNHLTDLAFDIEDGVWFAVDNDGTATTRILKGNIADLVSGTSNPTITVIYDFPNDDDNVPVDDDTFIDGIEIDTVNNQVYFIQGEIANGHNLMRVGYNGGAVSNWGPLDLAADQTIGIFRGGIYDFTLDVAHNTAYFTYVLVDTNFNPARAHVNYIVKVNSLVNPNPAVENYTIVPINGPYSDDPDGAGTNPANHFPDVANGSLAGIDIDIANQRIYFVTQRLGANGQAGVFMYDIASHNVTLVWQQQSNNATNTLQPFPTTQMLYIEVDTIGGRYYVSTLNNTDTAIGHDGTATDEGGSRIFSGSLTAFGVAPTVFASVFENTANGAVLGMEIDYAPTLTLSGAGSTYTESTNLPASPAGPTVDVATSPVVNDADQAIIQGATVAITTGFMAGDTLSFTPTGSIIGSYNATNGVLTLTGNGTFAQYQTVLDSVRFTNAGDNPTNYGNSPSRTISFTVTDGLLNSDPATATVAVVGINDAPVNTVGGTHNSSEDAIDVVLPGISVLDVDADPANQDIRVQFTVTDGIIEIRTDVVGGIVAGDITAGASGTATITITATQNQINATLAAANGLTFTPNTNFNGAATLTMVSNDLGLNGNDPGISGTGTSEQDSDNRTLAVGAVNDAPVRTGDGSEDAAAIFEDQPSAAGQTVFSLFNGQFSDAADQQQTGGNPTGSVANTLAGIAIVANGSSGATGQWQYFNGTIWVDIGAASPAAARTISEGTAIRFNPAQDFNGPAPTLTAHLIETGGAAIVNTGTVNISGVGATGGTTRYSTDTVVLSQQVNPVNDAPTSTNLSTDAATYTEGQTLALLDVGSNATVADIDSPNFDTGTLTVHIGAGLVAAEDQLVIDTSGTVTTGVGTVSVGGTQIGTFTGGGAGGGDLVFTFDADATPAAVQALIRAIGYANSGGDNPTAGARTITWTLVDGDGIANGGADTLNITSSVNAVAVNDAPQGTDATFAFNEDGSRILLAADFGFSDPAEGHAFAGVVITTLPTNGVLLLNGVPITVAGTFVTAAQISASQLVFQSDANENGAPYATFTFQVRDNGGTAGGGQDTDQSANTLTFDVTAVNDAPTSTNLAADAATFTEGQTLTLLDVGSNATVADVDSANFDTGTLTVAISSGLVGAEDQLVIDTSGTVTTGVGTVSVGGTQIGTFTGGGAGGGNLVFTFDADATPAAVQALIRAIGYANSGGDNPTEGARGITWTLVDGDGVANSGADTLIVNSSVNVVGVNDAPAGADATITINEDNTHVFTAANFGFSDVDGDNFAGVVITTLPASGTLSLNGVPIVAAGTFVSATDIGNNLLTYQPGLNGNGDTYASFTFQVRDDGGTAGGGQNTDQSANTITFDVDPVNDSPVIDLNGAGGGTSVTTGYTENGAPTAIAPAATVSDVDSANFDGGHLVVAYTANGHADDRLTIINQGTGAGQISVVGSDIFYEGATLIGTFTGGTGTTALDITLNVNATPAIVEALARAIAYSNVSEDPTTGDRGISFTLSDGDGNLNGGDDTDVANATVTIASVNDAPAGADRTVTISEDDPYTFLVSDFGFTDTDNDGFFGVKFTTLPPDGQILLNGVAIGLGDVIAVSAINAGMLTFAPDLDEFNTPYTSFTFQVQDNGGILNGGVDLDPSANNFTFNVTPDNFAPDVTVTDTLAYTENDAATVIAPNATVTDSDSPDFDGGSLTVSFDVNGTADDQLAIRNQGIAAGEIGVSGTDVTYGGVVIGTFGGGVNGADLVVSLNASATPAAVQALMRNITYANSSDDPSVLARTVNFEVTDGDGGLDSGNATVNVTAVNDAPTGTDNTITINEDSGHTFTAADFGFGDVEGDGFAGVVITTLPTAGVLVYDPDGPGFLPGVLASAGQFITAAELALGALIYFPGSNANGDGYASFTFQVRDDGGTAGGGQNTDQSANTITFDVDPVNDDPTIQLSDTGPSATLDYTENDAASVIPPTALVADIDSANFDTGTLTVSFQANGTTDDQLAIRNQGIAAGEIGVSGSDVTYGGTVIGTFTGGANGADLVITFDADATPAAVQALVRNITYANTSDDPSTLSRTVNFEVTDGDGGSAQANAAVNVTAVNDEPTLAATGQNPTYTEDGAAVDLFSAVTAATVEAGQTFAAMTLTVTNVTDGVNEILNIDGSDLALTNGNSVVGTATNGLTVNVAVAGNIATVTFSGAALSIAALQTLVDSLTYRNASQNPTDANRVVTITELVDSGSNASPDDNTSALNLASTVNVNPVNDAASISGTATGDVTEAGGLNNDIPGTPTATGDLDSTDVDNAADAWQPVLAGTASIGGYGTYEVDAAGVWTYTLDDNDPAVQALFGAATLNDTFNVTTVDGTAQLVTITIHAQDDFPTAQPDTVTTDEATVLNGNVFLDNGSGPDTDPDSPLSVLEVNGDSGFVGTTIILNSGATLRLNANGTFIYNPNGMFDVTPTPGSGASNQPATDSFVYTLTNGNLVEVTVLINGLDTDDVLLGTAGHDVLDAGVGNDILNGLEGGDDMTGGTGDDQYYVDHAADLVIEQSGGGFDIVYASANYGLAHDQEVEILSSGSLAATDPLVLVGNNLVQEILGNSGNNVLRGGGGADVLAGQDGDDEYYVTDGGERIVEGPGGGRDVVYTSLSYVLIPGMTQVEVLSALSISGTSALQLTGNEFVQQILGNNGNNVLRGGGGADALSGYGGNDEYYVTDGGETIHEAVGGGTDIVYASVDYVLRDGAEVEVLSTVSLGGTDAIDLTGNDSANVVLGNAGNNVLNGGLAADSLVGFGGADTFAFTTSLGGGNVDFILDFVSGTDTIALDNAVFTGLGFGTLSSDAFVVDSAALDGNDHILYNSSTGEIFFDADGNGDGVAVHFATVNAGTLLVAGDFTVI